ncbi:hypothetical protein [Tenacibaculum ovolyticum]|uniref:hypothetical protein n=1 Tax=Tenacibaculum ovolyticum TaxID=104270 RepID=UPI0004207DAF|nr:hypothetical protein [Tenacibaculum ovolyticum]
MKKNALITTILFFTLTLQAQWDTSSTNKLTTLKKVGIGTNTPSSSVLGTILEVNANGDIFPTIRLGRENGTEKENTNYDFLVSSSGDLAIRNKGQGYPILIKDGTPTGTYGLTINNEGNIGIGTTNPNAKLDIQNGGQRLTFLQGNNTSGYKLDIGLNDDGVNFTNNSASRGFNLVNTKQRIEFLTGNNTSHYKLSVGVNDDGVNFSNNSASRGFNLVNTKQRIEFLTGNNTSLYKLSVGVNDDGVNFSNNSASRGFNLVNTKQRIEFLTGNNTSHYKLSVGVNDDGVNFTNNSASRGFNFQNINGNLLKISNKGNAALNGKFEAKEIKVTNTPTADFVFEKNYNLPSLKSIEKHIKEKKHLPEIASAREMKKDGVNIGDFQIQLLQKIEELTLYTIEQEKKIKSLEKQNYKIEKQEKKIERLESLLEKLLENKNSNKESN